MDKFKNTNYSTEFKKKCVDDFLKTDLMQKDFCKNVGISQPSIRRWIKEHKKEKAKEAKEKKDKDIDLLNTNNQMTSSVHKKIKIDLLRDIKLLKDEIEKLKTGRKNLLAKLEKYQKREDKYFKITNENRILDHKYDNGRKELDNLREHLKSREAIYKLLEEKHKKLLETYNICDKGWLNKCNNLNGKIKNLEAQLIRVSDSELIFKNLVAKFSIGSIVFMDN